jgi:hypothetical protein
MPGHIRQRFSGSVCFLSLGCVTLLALGPQGIAKQEASAVDAQLVGAVNQFQSSDWHVRAEGFYRLLSVPLSANLDGRTWLIPRALATIFENDAVRKDQITVALIELLKKENATALRGSQPRLTEEYTSYWGDVIAAVAALRDNRGLRPLLDVLQTGNIATKAVAQLGRNSIPRVLELSTNTDMVIRNAATRTLSQMLDPPNIDRVKDARSLSRIKGALIRASKDQEHDIRISAVEGLAKFPDLDVTAVLKSIAEADPYRRPGDAGQPVAYPVREAAKRALALRAEMTRRPVN